MRPSATVASTAYSCMTISGSSPAYESRKWLCTLSPPPAGARATSSWRRRRTVPWPSGASGCHPAGSAASSAGAGGPRRHRGVAPLGERTVDGPAAAHPMQMSAWRRSACLRGLDVAGQQPGTQGCVPRHQEGGREVLEQRVPQRPALDLVGQGRRHPAAEPRPQAGADEVGEVGEIREPRAVPRHRRRRGPIRCAGRPERRRRTVAAPTPARRGRWRRPAPPPRPRPDR